MKIVYGDYVLNLTTMTIQGPRYSQEDRVSVHHNHGITCFGVFDGHGGSKVSDVLEKKLMPLMCDELKGYDDAIVTDRFFRLLFNKFNKSMCLDKGNQGSTATIGVIFKQYLYIVHVGDSRGIVTLDDKLIYETFDHTPSNEKDRITLRTHYMHPEYMVNPKYSASLLNVSRGFGDPEFVCPGGMIVDPVVWVHPLRPLSQSTVYLATDGVWDSKDKQASQKKAKAISEHVGDWETFIQQDFKDHEHISDNKSAIVCTIDHQEDIVTEDETDDEDEEEEKDNKKTKDPPVDLENPKTSKKQKTAKKQKNL